MLSLPVYIFFATAHFYSSLALFLLVLLMPVFKGKGRHIIKREFKGIDLKKISGKERKKILRQISRFMKGHAVDFEPELNKAVMEGIMVLNKSSFFVERNGVLLLNKKRVKNTRIAFERVFSERLRHLINATPVLERARLLNQFIELMNALQDSVKKGFKEKAFLEIELPRQLNGLKRQKIKIVSQIILLSTEKIKAKCKKYYRELPKEARKASIIEPFRFERLVDAFDFSFESFYKELNTRMPGFFVTRGKLRLLNEREIKSFKERVVSFFLKDFFDIYKGLQKNQRVSFLRAIIAYSNDLKRIGQEKALEKMQKIERERGFDFERAWRLRIVRDTWSAIGNALKNAAERELKKILKTK